MTTMMRTAAFHFGLAMALCSAAQPSLAFSANFDVRASVVPGCMIMGLGIPAAGANLGVLDFGVQPALSAGEYSATASLAGTPTRLQCTPGVAVNMSVDGGSHPQGQQRRMRSGTHYLPYDLSMQTNGGLPIAPGASLPIDASSGPTLLPVHGRVSVPPGGLPGGLYTDTVQIVLSW